MLALCAPLTRYRYRPLAPAGTAAGRSYQKIQKAICSGFFFHAARKDAQEGYKTGAWAGWAA